MILPCFQKLEFLKSYNDTPALCYDASVTWAYTYCASVPLFSTVPYFRVPIVQCPSHSIFLVYKSKHVYDKYMNNEA